jgi:hypothetical protein
MKQPRKDVLREHLAVAASEIERLRAENETLKRPWWQRLFHTQPAAQPTHPEIP